MRFESTGIKSGDDFEFTSLRYPDSSIILLQEEFERAARDAGFKEDKKRELLRKFQKLTERMRGDCDQIDYLRTIVKNNQLRDPSRIVTKDGRFMRPKTKFADALSGSLTRKLEEAYSGLGIVSEVRIFSAVHTVLDLMGVDGIIRTSLYERSSGRCVYGRDIDIDLTTNPEKNSSRSDIIIFSTIDDLGIEDRFNKLIGEISETINGMIKNKKPKRRGGELPTRISLA